MLVKKKNDYFRMACLNRIEQKIFTFVSENEGVTKSELRSYEFGTSEIAAAHKVAQMVSCGMLREEKPDHRSARLFLGNNFIKTKLNNASKVNDWLTVNAQGAWWFCGAPRLKAVFFVMNEDDFVMAKVAA